VELCDGAGKASETSKAKTDFPRKVLNHPGNGLECLCVPTKGIRRRIMLFIANAWLGSYSTMLEVGIVGGTGSPDKSKLVG